MKAKREAHVELARILACMIVVGVHVCLPQIVNDQPDLGRTFISCFLADGVAVFWLITGCFLFNNSNYTKLIKKTARHIVIPMVLLSVFIFFFGDFLQYGTPLSDSIIHPLSDYKEIVKSLFMWTNPVQDLGHLWYLYVYILVILIFPVLKSFVVYLDQDVKREKFFMGATLIFLIINDISKNQMAAFYHHSINGMIPACIEIIWGHILYKHRERFKTGKNVFFSIAIFVLINICRTFIQMARYRVDLADTAILYWYSSLGLFCALCIMLFCFSVKFPDRERPGRIIRKISSYTFLIYLIHPVVNNVLWRGSIRSRMMNMILVKDTVFCELLYTILTIAMVFLGSFIISVILRWIWNIFIKLTALKTQTCTRTIQDQTVSRTDGRRRENE